MWIFTPDINLNITFDIEPISHWMIFKLIFDLLNIIYVISCFVIFKGYVKYKDLDIGLNIRSKCGLGYQVRSYVRLVTKFLKRKKM